MDDFDVSSDPEKYKGTLARVLYHLNYERNKNLDSWSDHQKNYFLKVYGLEKIKIIAKCIQHYFDNRDLNLAEVLPTMSATIQEKEQFLKFVLDGFKESGFDNSAD